MTLWKLEPKAESAKMSNNLACRQIIFVHAPNERNARKAASRWGRDRDFSSPDAFECKDTYRAIRIDRNTLNTETCDAVLEHLYPVCFSSLSDMPAQKSASGRTS